MRTWMIVCVIGLIGCAESRQYFRPTEHVYGETVRGEREAIYNLVGPLGQFGEAKVWSRGAFREDGQTIVFTTIELHNTSGSPLLVDPQRIRLDPVRAGAELLHDFPPVERQVLSVAPGAFGSVRLRFVLPPDVPPGKVSSFGLRWEVKNGPQSYSQRTPFLEDRGGRAYAAYPPPTYGWNYGLYGYGGYGGFGYGYGGCWGDPLCRGPYGYGPGFGVGAGPINGGPISPPRPSRDVIRTR